MGNPLNSIAVFCGSSLGNNPKIIEDAQNLGKILALQKIDLVYGGSKLGLMGEVARGVLKNGGNAIGVIPEFLRTKEVVHPGLTELHITETMQERKLKMHELCHGIIVLPGGFGTMEEFFEIITWSQLGIHRKPIGILNSGGFYDQLIQMLETMVKTGLLKQDNFDILLVSDSTEELLGLMKTYQPHPVPKWMNKEQI